MKRIAKQEIGRLVTHLMPNRAVYAPSSAGKYVTYQRIESPDEIVWDVLVTREPPKKILLPQTEVLMEYRRSSEGLSVRSTEKVGQEAVIWGMRPCGARAIRSIDLVFDTQENPDVYYVNRREKTALVGIGCNRPLSTCFCTTVGGSPFEKENFDLFLTDIGDAFVVEVLSPKGEELLAGFDLSEASEEDRAAAQVVEEEALARMDPVVDIEPIKDHLDALNEHPFWEEVHSTCLGCGVCTLLCPACYCFDIVDEGAPDCGVRLRNWDTCQFCIYSQEASGHNPRPTGRERMRQRLMHKFNYELVNEGVLGCVGCGRCVQSCPVNIDIRETLKQIQAVPVR